MKKKSNNRGFAFVLLVLFIAVIGFETVVLSGMSNKMAFETNEAYLTACKENLIISGLTWAKENSERNVIDEEVSLDITSLALHNAELHVTINLKQTPPQEANITASCSTARQKLNTDNTYEF